MFLDYLKMLFCEHDYCDVKLDPYIDVIKDSYKTRRSYTLTCKKCHKIIRFYYDADICTR